MDGALESLFADADNEKAVDNFNLRTEDQRVSDVQKEIVSDVLKEQQLIFRGPQWKAMNHQLKKSANVRQKKTLFGSIFVIVASYLIFPNKHL